MLSLSLVSAVLTGEEGEDIRHDQGPDRRRIRDQDQDLAVLRPARRARGPDHRVAAAVEAEAETGARVAAEATVETDIEDDETLRAVLRQNVVPFDPPLLFSFSFLLFASINSLISPLFSTYPRHRPSPSSSHKKQQNT